MTSQSQQSTHRVLQAGEESVWDYPRPPHMEATSKHLRVTAFGHVLADTTRAYRILETSHPPCYYIPREDIDMSLLKNSGKDVHTFCEWKGIAEYFDLDLKPNHAIPQLAWSYPSVSNDKYKPIEGYLAFYANKEGVECFVDEERIVPQPGQFYGGWIHKGIVGPFKGEPGTNRW